MNLVTVDTVRLIIGFDDNFASLVIWNQAYRSIVIQKLRG